MAQEEQDIKRNEQPHSDFPYKSMTDPLFKLCWALDNLQPLSAKENQRDGVSRARHKTPRKKGKKK